MTLPIRRALVTGANGFIGGALTLRLLAEGTAVRAVCRNPANGQFLIGAEVVQGDIQDADRMRSLAHGCDVIFHVAAVANGSRDRHQAINVTGAENVTRATIAAGASRLVHISSVAVYGLRISGTIDEDMPFAPAPYEFYQQTKAAGEHAVRDLADHAGLPAAIIRPACVYGPRSELWTRGMYDLCRRLRAIPAFPGDVHPIFIDDLVDLLIAAAISPNAPGEAFNASAAPVPWAEFLGYYAHMAGIARRMGISPRLLTGFAPFARILDSVLRITGKSHDFSGSFSYLASRARYSIDKARDRLNWHPKTSLAAGMVLSEAWLRTDS